MLLASLQNVTKRYGDQAVLRGASFTVSSGQKLGVIGPNGSGKTTILRILLGREPPSDGTAVLAKGVRVGYVPQYVEYDEEQTVLECILAEHRRLAAEVREQEERLAHAGSSEMDRALRRYQGARDEYDRIGGDDVPRRARAMLDALGLAGRGGQQITSLSGGEKNVLSLTQAMLAEPDLLVLDEPANHLDYLGVAWLEDFLTRFRGAALVVSHNRYLLDRVAGGILQLDNGAVRYYDGGYSACRATRLRELLARQSDYVANQKRLAQLEALVQRFAEITKRSSDPAWGRRLRARRSQLAREKRAAVDRPTLGPDAMRVDFEAEASRANIAVQVRGYRKAFGELHLFDNVDLDIGCGERVALVGPNGCGKSSLLRDIIEHGEWDHDVIRIGPSLRVGYCPQEQETLQGDNLILDEVVSVGGVSRRDASGLLGRLLFPWERLDKRVADLSGGERNRLQLAKLIALKPNFLVLDEPTNHLDIPAREAVEEALSDFDGTILVVSHDRYFLDKIVSRVVEVRDRRLISYPGNFSDFWHARRAARARTVGRVTERRKQRGGAAPRAGGDGAAELERRIDEAEGRVLELERRVADAFERRDHREGRRASKQLEQLRRHVNDLYQKWLAADS